jgi:hypothetical protein
MENDKLASYLRDHMAGSVGAVEMLEHLIESHQKEPISQFCRELLEAVRADQGELKEIMDALDISEGGVRKAGAWVTEKVSRAKLKLEGAGGLAQGLEALVLGITGKKLLWRALAALRKNWPQLKRFDLARLERRAVDQAKQTDVHRIEAAAKVFGQRES